MADEPQDCRRRLFVSGQLPTKRRCRDAEDSMTSKNEWQRIRTDHHSGEASYRRRARGRVSKSKGIGVCRKGFHATDTCRYRQYRDALTRREYVYRKKVAGYGTPARSAKRSESFTARGQGIDLGNRLPVGGRRYCCSREVKTGSRFSPPGRSASASGLRPRSAP